MIDILSHTILWWHWIILGFILLILEMTTGTFILLGLGLSSIIVGLLDISFDLSFNVQVLLWLVLSIFSLVAWKKWVKEEHVSNSGQSNYNLDILGTVVTQIEPHKRGKVTFDTPVLGNTTWHATAETKIEVGTRVTIREVKGQLIEVQPQNIKG